MRGGITPRNRRVRRRSDDTAEQEDGLGVTARSRRRRINNTRRWMWWRSRGKVGVGRRASEARQGSFRRHVGPIELDAPARSCRDRPQTKLASTLAWPRGTRQQSLLLLHVEQLLCAARRCPQWICLSMGPEVAVEAAEVAAARVGVTRFICPISIVPPTPSWRRALSAMLTQRVCGRRVVCLSSTSSASDTSPPSPSCCRCSLRTWTPRAQIRSGCLAAPTT